MVTATATGPQKAFLWLIPSIFTIALLVVATATASNPARLGASVVALIPGLLGVGVGWFSSVSIPRRVTVSGARLVLERPIGSLSVPIGEIRRVNASPWNHGLVTLAVNRRKIFLLRNTRNLFAVVAEIKRQNPSVTVVGDVPLSNREQG